MRRKCVAFCSKRLHCIIYQAEYFLKWTGYDESHNTWVSENRLHCDKLLMEFEQKIGRKRPRNSATAKKIKSNNNNVERNKKVSTKAKRNSPVAPHHQGDIDDVANNIEIEDINIIDVQPEIGSDSGNDLNSIDCE